MTLLLGQTRDASGNKGFQARPTIDALAKRSLSRASAALPEMAKGSITGKGQYLRITEGLIRSRLT